MNKVFTLVVLYLLLSYSAFAQNTLRGTVLANDNNEPIAGASVYISNTTIGTATNGQGFFQLTNVPSSPFELNISSIGFKTKVLSIDPLKDTLLNVKLLPQVQKLREVVVRPKDDDWWDKFGQKFLEDIIGYSIFSKQCTIENAEKVILEYDKQQQKLKGFCREPLIIVNKALGYKITYWLEHYELSLRTKRTFYGGYPFFEDLLTPKTRKRKAKRYRKNRRKAYRGSFNHFVRTLYANQTKQEGFQVDLMKQVEISQAYNQRSKRIDTLTHNKTSLEKIFQAIASKVSPKNLQYYQRRIKNWYNNSNKRTLRLKLISKNRKKITAYELTRKPPNQVIVTSYPLDMKLERQARKGKVRAIVAKDIDVNKFVKPLKKGNKSLSFENYLYVTYKNEIEEEAYQKARFPFRSFVRKKQTSTVSLFNQSRITIHPNGYYTPQVGLLTEGYWSYEKMDQMLPLDYIPPSKIKK